MITSNQIPDTMDCVVVGGCADSTILHGVLTTAERIELARPEYVKPLASSDQLQPDVAKETDTYTVHPVLLEDADSAAIVGIAVVAGKNLTWALTQLISGYVENTTNKLIADGLIHTQ